MACRHGRGASADTALAGGGLLRGAGERPARGAVLRLAAGRKDEPSAVIIYSRTLRSTPESFQFPRFVRSWVYRSASARRCRRGAARRLRSKSSSGRAAPCQQRLAPAAPTAQPGHAGRRSDLVDEHEAVEVEPGLRRPPELACDGDVRPILLGRVDRPFFCAAAPACVPSARRLHD